MTPEKAMDLADALRPNELGPDLKRKWLTDIENECIEHLNRHEGGGAAPWVCTEDEERTEMIMPEPYEMAYVYKLAAEIDGAVGEYDRYNLDAQRANAYLDDWKAWYRRNHMPKADHRKGWKIC